MAQLTAGPVWSALEISYIEMELHGVIKIRITAGFQCMQIRWCFSTVSSMLLWVVFTL